MEKTVFENWITSEDQKPINLQEHRYLDKGDMDGAFHIWFLSKVKGLSTEAWIFDRASERDTAYANIQKLMVNIDFK